MNDEEHVRKLKVDSAFVTCLEQLTSRLQCLSRPLEIRTVPAAAHMVGDLSKLAALPPQLVLNFPYSSSTNPLLPVL